jgi:anti-sigma factor RsiW
MINWTGMDDEGREKLINAFIDGELTAAEAADLDAAAKKDAALALALGEAQELRQMLTGMPLHRAPRKLRRRLLAVPEAPSRTFSPVWWPRIGVAAASLLIAVLLLDGGDPEQPGLAKIEQGRRDLALALVYLGRASQRARLEIDTRIDSALVEPVTDHTAELLSLTPVLNEEFEL